MIERQTFQLWILAHGYSWRMIGFYDSVKEASNKRRLEYPDAFDWHILSCVSFQLTQAES